MKLGVSHMLHSHFFPIHIVYVHLEIELSLEIIKFALVPNNFIISTVSHNQIERLYSRFTSLDRTDCGTLSREDFLRIPELAINPLCDRIVHAFFADSTDDRVNFRQFMQVLAHFRPIKKNSPNKLNSREEKLKCK